MSEKQKRRKRKVVNSPFGKNLEALLKEKGLKQSDAAKLIGVAPSVINTWISNASPQNLRAVLKLCEALNADFQEVLTGVPSASHSGELEKAQLMEFFDVGEEQLSGIFFVQAKRLKPKGRK